MKMSWTMLTLCSIYGKENEIRTLLERAIKAIGIQYVTIVYGGKRKIHYHIIGKDITPYIKRSKGWPGIVKVQEVTESQAQEIIRTHKDYLAIGGPQHEGSNSTSI